jgi:hypothetical protein
MSEHTPAPWSSDGPTVRGPNGEWLVDEWFNPANAAFIVRAVNSHEALVEALKEAGLWLHALVPATVRAQIDAALALAGADQ